MEIAEQATDTRLHPVQVEVVAKACFQVDSGDAGLFVVDFPGVKVEEGGLFVVLVDPFQQAA